MAGEQALERAELRRSAVNFRTLVMPDLIELVYKKSNLTTILLRTPPNTTEPPHYFTEFMISFQKCIELAGAACEDDMLMGAIEEWFEVADQSRRADKKMGIVLANMFLGELRKKKFFTLFEESTNPLFVPLTGKPSAPLDVPYDKNKIVKVEANKEEGDFELDRVGGPNE